MKALIISIGCNQELIARNRDAREFDSSIIQISQLVSVKDL